MLHMILLKYLRRIISLKFYVLAGVIKEKSIPEVSQADCPNRLRSFDKGPACLIKSYPQVLGRKLVSNHASSRLTYLLVARLRLACSGSDPTTPLFTTPVIAGGMGCGRSLAAG